MISFIAHVPSVIFAMAKNPLSWGTIVTAWNWFNTYIALRDRSKEVINALTETITELQTDLQRTVMLWEREKTHRDEAYRTLTERKAERNSIETQLDELAAEGKLLDAIIKKAKSQPDSGSHLAELDKKREKLDREIRSLKRRLTPILTDIDTLTRFVVGKYEAMKKLGNKMTKLESEILKKIGERQKAEERYKQATKDAKEWRNGGEESERAIFEELKNSIPQIPGG